jgi:WD40 repeat protein
VKQNTPPQVELQLEWVHGYRCHDTRNNIAIGQDKNIIYHAAGLGIAYDPSTHTQRFMSSHIDDVTAIAFSPDKRLVATGEIGAKPMICIWDAVTMQLKYPPIKGKLTKGIQALSFSSTGQTLAAVCIDVDHTVAVINVETKTMVTAKGDQK